MVMHRIVRSPMRKGYFQKLEFDAAGREVDISRRGRSVLGAPLWLYPTVVGAFWRWILILLAGSRRAGAFDQQLDWFRYMERLPGYWMANRGQGENG